MEMNAAKFGSGIKTPAAAVVLLCLTAVVYAPVFFSTFTYDGRLVVGDNPVVAKPAAWRLMFSKNYYDAFGEDSYRPASTATYLLDAKLYGVNKAGFAVTGVLLHALAALALFIVLRHRMESSAAFLASVIFVAHPVYSEAIYTVGHRETILGGLFVFTCIALNDKAAENRKCASALLYFAFILGLFAVESVILAPAYLLAESVLVGKKPAQQTLIRIAVLLLIAGTYYLLRPHYFLAANNPAHWFGGSWAASAAHGFGAFFTYMRLLVAPLGLRPDYGRLPFALTSHQAVLGMACAAGMIALALSRKVNPRVKTFLSWIVISLIPFLHFLTPFWISVAERYLYVGAAFFSALAALGIRRIYLKSKKAAPALAAVIIFAFGTLTFVRGFAFQNDLSLWSDATRKQPDSVVAWTNLAQARLEAGDVRGRKEALRRILKIDPGNEKASVNLANILRLSGDKQEAVSLLEKSAKAHGDSAIVYEALGIEYLKEGKFDEARKLFERLFSMAGGELPAARSMARLHFVRRDMEKLIEAVGQCLELDARDAMCRQIEGILLMRAGQYGAAARSFAICADHAEDAALIKACEKNRKKCAAKGGGDSGDLS